MVPKSFACRGLGGILSLLFLFYFRGTYDLPCYICSATDAPLRDTEIVFLYYYTGLGNLNLHMDFSQYCFDTLNT